MSYIVAARFDSWESAGVAARALHGQGYPDSALHTFYVNSPGAHAQHPVGGDRTADSDARGAQFGAVAGAAVLGMAGAAIFSILSLAVDAPLYVIVAAGAVGAYIGSLIGAMKVAGHRKNAGVARAARAEQGTAPGADRLRDAGTGRSRTAAADAEAGYSPVRHAGVLLAVHASPEQETTIAHILRDAGGMDIERAQGHWAKGSWVDFDPVAAPRLSDKVEQTA